jgi:hypothetical protein
VLTRFLVHLGVNAGEDATRAGLLAAAAKPLNWRVTPGMTSDVTVSAWHRRGRTSSGLAPASLIVACAPG